MNAFDYAAPASIEDAVKLLATPKSEACLGRHRPALPLEGLRVRPGPRRLISKTSRPWRASRVTRASERPDPGGGNAPRRRPSA